MAERITLTIATTRPMIHPCTLLELRIAPSATPTPITPPVATSLTSIRSMPRRAALATGQHVGGGLAPATPALGSAAGARLCLRRRGGRGILRQVTTGGHRRFIPNGDAPKRPSAILHDDALSG